MRRSEEFMLRRVLTIYLAFLTVAAPCLCCCTAARALAAEHSSKADPRPSCCRHDVTPEPTPIPSTPAPQDRCPCRDHAEKPIQAVDSVTSDLVFLRAALQEIFVGAVAIVPPVLIPEVVDQANSQLLREPWPSATDLLHAHHRLRC
jgi:hypothetical protein